MTKEKALRLVEVALAVASMSKNPKRKVGAIIMTREGQVVATGFNDLSSGIPHNATTYGPNCKKYFLAHAEENAIAQAAKMGHSTNNCVMLVTGLQPCHTCARLIAQAGITTVYYPKADAADPKWDTSFMFARTIFEAKGVHYEEY